MDFQALKHLSAVVAALAPGSSILIFGSSSAFASHPKLAETVSMYQNTQDADFVPDPMDEMLFEYLRDTLGKESRFFQVFGYYADINGPRAFDYFPAGFRDRLVPLPGVANVFALEPNDMAVAKLIAAREKDIHLLSILLAQGCLNEAAIRTRLWFMEMDDKLRIRTDQALKATLTAARALGYAVECPEQPWNTSAP